MHRSPLPSREVGEAPRSEVPVQTGASVQEERKGDRNTGSHRGRDEDAEEEGGNVEVIPVKVWTG